MSERKGEPITVFACGRAGDVPGCKVCNRRTRHACPYPLRGRLEGKTCGTPLCRAHAHGEQGHCLPHHEIEQRKGA